MIIIGPTIFKYLFNIVVLIAGCPFRFSMLAVKSVGPGPPKPIALIIHVQCTSTCGLAKVVCLWLPCTTHPQYVQALKQD